MHQRNHKSLFCIISIVFLIFNSLIRPLSSAYVDEQYANCATVDYPCGSSLKVQYPFRYSTQKEQCGHPGFNLKCQGDSLTIDIKNETYNVLDINYNSTTFTISRQLFSKGLCPKNISELTNSTLDLTIFNFTSSSENATLFYNCEITANGIAPFAFPCPDDNYLTVDPAVFRSNFNFIAIDEKWKVELRKNCPVEIYIPVFQTQVVELSNGKININDVVGKGFELKWTTTDESQCKACSKSTGRCGYNSTLSEPVCFCQDGALNPVCGQSNAAYESIAPNSPDQLSPSKKTTTFMGAGIAAAAAAASVILLSLFCFFYRRNYKQNRSSEGAIPRHFSRRLSTALDPYGSTYFGVEVLSYTALEEATDYFNPAKELGVGGFGTVYYGVLHDGREVAVKRLYERNNKRSEQFLNEVEILANLRHKNLVNLYGCTSRQSRELLLVYEYVQNGTVADHLHGKNANLRLLPWPKRLRIAIESACALVYLHASDIIHRDIKTQNVLLDKDFSVKVADFGLSRLFPLDVTHVSTAPQGTPGYMDPEYHQCYQLTEKSDVYSFGVLLAELISSKPAVDITRRRTDINLSNMLLSKIENNALEEFVDEFIGFQSDSEVKKEITGVADLAVQCLQSTREMRPSMEQVLERLYNIKDHKDKIDRQDVVDIPLDDVFILKGEYSSRASSPRDDNLERILIPHASV